MPHTSDRQLDTCRHVEADKPGSEAKVVDLIANARTITSPSCSLMINLDTASCVIYDDIFMLIGILLHTVVIRMLILRSRQVVLLKEWSVLRNKE